MPTVPSVEPLAKATVMVGQPMVNVYAGPVPLQPFESVAVTVMMNVPLCVGVPERRPVDECGGRPGGGVAVETVNVAEPRLWGEGSVEAGATAAVPVWGGVV